MFIDVNNHFLSPDNINNFIAYIHYWQWS